MDYGKAVRICRAAYGLTQADLAKRLRTIGPSQLSLIESGKRQPSLKALDDIAEALKIPQSLLTLLASRPRDIKSLDDEHVTALAQTLLKLLVSASDEDLQQSLPFSKDRKGTTR